MLPYSRQTISSADVEAVVAALQSDWLTTGPAVEAFENEFAKSTQSTEAVAFCNGTAALHAAMAVLGIGPDDEVIVPAITFVATANAVLYQGGVPVFADVDAQTLLLDPDHVERLITKQTRAIIAVDYAGQPCDYQALSDIARRHGLAIVADACHSVGARFGESPVGSLADLTCFSFHPVKPMTTAEGGMVTTRDRDLAAALRKFRNHGIAKDFRQREAALTYEYDMSELGFNYRLSDLHAALGLSQLKQLDDFRKARSLVAGWYRDRLVPLKGLIDPLEQREECVNAWHLFVVRIRHGCGITRDHLFRELRAEDIGVNVHYLPVYLHSYYRGQFGYRRGLCPVAEKAHAEILSLPIFPGMTEDEVDRVCSVIERSIAMGFRTCAA
jgi:UDP-4-amino-4,6-dideoxy-N-acetyl-beta-L-altrosamine transaminase